MIVEWAINRPVVTTLFPIVNNGRHERDAKLQSDQLINTAMDVFSACLMYLAIHIDHECNRLGVIGIAWFRTYVNVKGSIGTTVVKGQEAFANVETGLGNSVEEFHRTLSHYAHDVQFRAFEMGSQTLDVVQGKPLCSILIPCRTSYCGSRRTFTNGQGWD